MTSIWPDGPRGNAIKIKIPMFDCQDCGDCSLPDIAYHYDKALRGFKRFPTWMWRNEETRGFVDWLHRRLGLDVAAVVLPLHGPRAIRRRR